MFHQVADAAPRMWQQVQARTLETMPAVAAALLVLVLGALLGWLARRLVVAVLRRRGSRWAATGLGWGESLRPWTAPLVAGRSVQWFVVFCSTIVALYALDPRLASTLAERVLLYVPYLAGAIVILAVGILLSKFVGRTVLIAAVNHEIGSPRLLAGVARSAVVVVASAMALEHAGIGQRTVLVAFGILFGGLTLAASIALGLALKDPLRRWLLEHEASRPRHEREHEARPVHHV